MFKYRIMPEHKLIVLCNYGTTSVEEIMEVSQNLRSDPNYSPTYDAILDNSHFEQAYTSEEIRKLADQRDRSYILPIRLAIIATKDVVFGMSRMYEIMTDGENPVTIGVFRDTDSALQWLNKKGIDVERILAEMREGKK